MGELWEWVQRWAWLISLLAMVWCGVEAVRYERKASRLDRETYEKRPLIPDDKVAIMRPGDTVLLMPSLDDMTLDQQTQLVGAIKRMAERASALGIEFVVIPDWGGQKTKAIVVSRSVLSEHADNGGHDTNNGGNRTPEYKQTG